MSEAALLEAKWAPCSLASANSIFTGDKLHTTGNAGGGADAALYAKPGVRPMAGAEPMREAGA